MKLNKYKLKDSDTELLIYTLTDELTLPLEDLNLELVEENPILEENAFIPLIKAEDLLERIITHKRTRDTVLSDEHIDSWNNLKAAYYAMKNNMTYFSRRIREFITKKYSEIVNNYDYCYNTNMGSSDRSDILSTLGGSEG